METSVLIKAMAADSGRPSMPLGRAWPVSLAVGVVVAAVVFMASLGMRPDFENAARTMRFLFKFVVMAALALTAVAVLFPLSRPDPHPARRVRWLLLAPALLAIGVGLELATLPQAEWMPTMMGSNNMVCLTYIPLIAVGPLAIFLATLRFGAPTRPRLAGAVAGILAGGVAAFFYAAQCIDDSPLFVAVWYTIAISGLAIIGAVFAPRIARW
jgi:hypothetical protein